MHVVTKLPNIAVNEFDAKELFMLLTAQRFLPDGIRSCIESEMIQFTLPAERVVRYPQLVIAILQVKSTGNMNNNGLKMSVIFQRD